jgi:ABC-2 type transport system permease protein
MDATLPPAPGVIVFVGDAAQRPISATINSSTRADTLFKNTEIGSALSASFGTLDLTWAAIVLFPLLLIALTHDVLAAERDAARLGLLRVQAGDLRQLLVRRLAIRVSLPLFLVTIGAASAAVLGANSSVITSWWLIICLYLILWGALGALVSVRAATTQSAAAILLLLWLGFIVLLPSAAMLAVDRLAPVPSRLSHVIAMREVQLGLQERTAELLDRFFTDHPELAGADRSGFARSSFVAQRETEAQLTPVLKTYAQRRLEQRRWSGILSWLSPPLLVHSNLVHIAGTDGARHDAFLDQANEFAARWREQIRERLFRDQKLSPEEVAALPRFSFREPFGFGSVIVSIIYLAVLIGIVATLLSRALRSPEWR